MRLVGGRVVSCEYLDDGVDILITRACGRPGCPGCAAAPQAKTKIEPTNCRIQPGDLIKWAGPWVTWFRPVAEVPGAFKRAGRFPRIGVYRKVRPDGTCAPGPVRVTGEGLGEVAGEAVNPPTPNGDASDGESGGCDGPVAPNA